MARAFDVRLELTRVTPTVWRVLRVPATLRLDDLHHAIQTVMGWDDFHPHVFEVGPREYGPPPDADADDDEDESAGESSAWAGDDSEVTIGEALAASPGGITYIYDFAEDWRVRITADAGGATSSDHVVCLAGAETGPQQERGGFDLFSVDAAHARLERARRRTASSTHPAGPRANADQQLLAHLTLVVLFLGSRPAREGARESTRTFRPEILDSLQEAGLVDHETARRSVTLTVEGVAHAQRLLRKLRSL
jgi:hypothetical protein